jgi:N,N'-diacetyllegionaminate synthase
MSENRFIIAEIGSVHDGSIGNALKLIEVAKNCGANVVKFQTHLAQFETTLNAPSPSYFESESRFEYFERTAFTEKNWINLYNFAKKLGVLFSSSVFSHQAVDLLMGSGIDIIKIPSGEVTNVSLLKYVADLSVPVFLSSGMSDWKELDAAVQIFENCDLTIFQCSSIYPCPPSQIGLNLISEIRQRYRRPVGLSDHSEGTAAALASIALGATAIEKHLTFSKLMYGSDAMYASEPHTFKLMSNQINDIWQMLDNPVDKNNLDRYSQMKLVFEKSIATSRLVKSGEEFSIENLALLKPGHGIKPGEINKLLGKIALRNIGANEIITWDDVS